MTPRGYNRKKVEDIEVKVPVIKGIEAKADNDSEYASRIEVTPSREVDPTIVYNAHPAYDYHWCNKNKMAAGRRGIWQTVLKDHPHFKDVKVHTDHTPDANFFTYGDLILCQCRKETAQSKRDALHDKVARRDKAMVNKDTETMARISKGGIKENIRTLEKAVSD